MLGLTGVSEVDRKKMNDIVDVYGALDNTSDLSAQILITNPNKGGGVRGKVFHNLTVASIDDGEQVTVGALQVSRTISFMYVSSQPLL